MNSTLPTRNQIMSYFSQKINVNFENNYSEYELTTIFCIFDDILKKFNHKDHYLCRIKLAEVITIIYLAAQEKQLNYSKSIKDFYQILYHRIFGSNKPISESRFSWFYI